MTSMASRLSQSPPFGYDLVVGVTQNALNSTLKRYLHGFDGEDVTVFFGTSTAPDGGLTRIDPADMAEVSDAGDPFDIPDGTEPDDERLRILHRYGFRCGFRARFGLPEGLALTNIPAVIRLDRGNGAVSYQLFFAELEIVVLRPDETARTFRWTRVAQDGKQPWVFGFDVDLSFARQAPGDVTGIDDEALGALRALDSSFFSVQQLYLDLNSATLQSSPSVTGVAAGSVEEAVLRHDFLGEYWARLKRSGEVVLGYVVKATGASAPTSSFVPTGYTLGVSPHVGADGTPDGVQGLATLNYLVMTGNRVVPAPAPFPWNWAEAGTQAHGAMSVNRSVIASVLRDELLPPFRELCVEPAVRTSNADVGLQAHMSIGRPGVGPDITVHPPPGSTGGTSRDGYTPLLAFTWSRKAHDESRWGPSTIVADIAVTSSMTVSVRGDRLRVDATATGWLYTKVSALKILFVDAGSTLEGTVVDRKATIDYQLTVGPDGALQATPTGPPSLTDDSRDVDTDSVLIDDPASIVKWLRESLTVAQNITGLAGALTAALSSPGSGWVFPGGQAFVFKNVTFSDQQDLVSQITYATPIDAPA